MAEIRQLKSSLEARASDDFVAVSGLGFRVKRLRGLGFRGLINN